MFGRKEPSLIIQQQMRTAEKNQRPKHPVQWYKFLA